MAADIPDTLGQQVRWQRVIDDRGAEVYHVWGVMAGASVPIIVTGHGAMGLNPDTGETTWSYRDPEVTVPVTGYGLISAERAHGQAALSPDGTHLVLGLSTSTSNFAIRLVGLDTGTGEVLFDHKVTDYVIVTKRVVNLHIQVTDHVVIAEREVILLEDGSVLATLPPDPAVVYGDRQCLRTDMESCTWFWPGSQRGHSTLILDSIDGDPTAIQTVGGVIPAENGGPEAIEGWVMRYVYLATAYAEPSQSSREDPERTAEAGGRGLTCDAVDLDSVSGPRRRTVGAGYILRVPGVIAVVDQHVVVNQATGDTSNELMITALR